MVRDGTQYLPARRNIDKVDCKDNTDVTDCHQLFVIDIAACLYVLYLLVMAPRKQLNLRADPELLEMIGELQRLDRSGPTAPSMTEVIRKAVSETLDRWRHATEKAGKRK